MPRKWFVSPISLWCCFLLGGAMLALWSPACAPPKPPQATTCTTSIECPGSKECVSGTCVFALQQTKEPLPEHAEGQTNQENPHDGAPDSSENVPEDGGGKEVKPDMVVHACTDGTTQDCTAGECGAGTQHCRSQVWGPCVPKTETRSCYDGPAGTENKGECKSGLQTCKDGKWGECVGQVKPEAKDTCGDKKDNDCDGVPDNGCVCTAGQTQPCGKNVGECKQGTQTCDANGQWGSVCVGEVAGTNEKCDGLDNDCDGQVDEDFPKKGDSCDSGVGACNSQGKFVCSTDGTGLICDAKPSAPTPEQCNNKDDDCNGKIDDALTRQCFPSGATGCTLSGTSYICKGVCKFGGQTCNNGVWSACTGEVVATAEKCRNNLDDDCDGLIDDICGNQPPFLVFDGISKILRQSKAPQITAVKNVTGRYNIKFTGYSCVNSSLILTGHGSTPVTISYLCNGDSFDIITSNPQGTLTDSGFSAVLLPGSSGEVWGRVDDTQCLAASPYTCNKQDNYYGGATVIRPRTGIYEIKHANCSSANSPYFASLFYRDAKAFVTIYYLRTGTCGVSVFDTNGRPTNRSFTYWIPNTKNYAWANISGTGVVTSSHFFSDTFAKWNATQNTTTKTYNVVYSGWGSPSAVLLAPQTSKQNYAVSQPKAGLSNGVEVINFLWDTAIPKPELSNFSVMFLQ